MPHNDKSPFRECGYLFYDVIITSYQGCTSRTFIKYHYD